MFNHPSPKVSSSCPPPLFPSFTSFPSIQHHHHPCDFNSRHSAFYFRLYFSLPLPSCHSPDTHTYTLPPIKGAPPTPHPRQILLNNITHLSTKPPRPPFFPPFTPTTPLPFPSFPSPLTPLPLTLTDQQRSSQRLHLLQSTLTITMATSLLHTLRLTYHAALPHPPLAPHYILSTTIFAHLPPSLPSTQLPTHHPNTLFTHLATYLPSCLPCTFISVPENTSVHLTHPHTNHLTHSHIS